MDYKGKPFSEIKKEGKLFVLAALIKISEYSDKNLVLNPDNLIYDIHGGVQIKNEEHGDFLLEYKALIGECLQNKYKYCDYRDGGMSLLNRDGILKNINCAESIEEIVDILQAEYDKEYHTSREGKINVNKKKIIILYVLVTCLSILLLASIIYLYILLMTTTRVKNADIKGMKAYINREYDECVRAYEKVNPKRLEAESKYIYAVSLVRCENLTPEQKDNIVEDLSNNRLEIKYDYWISLHERRFKDAEDCAMSLSDDELLLYSYMKEATYLKNEIGIQGEEKATRIEELQKEISRLSKEYETEDDE